MRAGSAAANGVRKGGEVIRVLVVDDHSFVRAGLTEMLDAAEGIEVIGECPQSRVLMVTGSMSGRVMREAARAGAFGFVLKDGDPRLLIEAVRTVASGATARPAGT